MTGLSTPSMSQAQQSLDGHRPEPHAVVIGSGFGGLAAAIRLGCRGYRVTVLERLDQPGGRARVHRQDGFTFDAGPTVITAPFLLRELWQLCGRRMEDHIDLRPVSPFYLIRFDDGKTFEYTGSPEAMRQQVAKFSPTDVAGYDALVRFSEKIFNVGFEQLAHVPFGRAWDMARIVPQMARLESYRSVFGLVSRYIKDDHLRQVFSFHSLLVGGNPFSTTSIYALIAFLERKWGVHFPIGGTGALVRGLVELIESVGGTIRLGATVDRILVEQGRVRGVRLESGETVPADIVVSNADAAWTYAKLLPPEHRSRWTDKRLARSRYSMGLFVWYFGTDRVYPEVPHHTILMGPRYRELLADIFQHHKLAQDFSLYLHRPTATDPALAPDGCDAFYVLSPVPNLRGSTDWNAEAGRYRDKISRYLEDTVLPGLSDHVVTSLVATPQTFRDELLSLHGSGFSLEPSLTQSAWFRPHNRSEEVEGLYLVGAGTHPGAGVPGVLSSAKVLDSVVPDPSELEGVSRATP